MCGVPVQVTLHVLTASPWQETSHHEAMKTLSSTYCRMVSYAADNGGKAWESNPPGTGFQPLSGFEDRATHRCRCPSSRVLSESGASIALPKRSVYCRELRLEVAKSRSVACHPSGTSLIWPRRPMRTSGPVKLLVRLGEWAHHYDARCTNAVQDRCSLTSVQVEGPGPSYQIL